MIDRRILQKSTTDAHGFADATAESPTKSFSTPCEPVMALKLHISYSRIVQPCHQRPPVTSAHFEVWALARHIPQHVEKFCKNCSVRSPQINALLIC